MIKYTCYTNNLDSHMIDMDIDALMKNPYVKVIRLTKDFNKVEYKNQRKGKENGKQGNSSNAWCQGTLFGQAVKAGETRY